MRRFLALLLLLTACSSDVKNPGPTSTKLDAKPSPDGSSLEVSSDGIDASPSVGELSTSKPQSSPAIFNDQHPRPRDPVGTMNALLDAIETNHYAQQRELASGGALAMLNVRAISAAENLRRGGKTTNTIAVAREPAIQVESESEATLNFEATVTSTISGDKGTETTEDTISSPVKVNMTDAWRINTFAYDESPLEQGYKALSNSSATSHDFELIGRSVVSYKSTTAVLVDLRAHKVPGEIRIVKGTLSTASDDEQTLKSYAFEGGSQLGYFRFERISGDPISLEIQGELVGENKSLIWNLDLK